MFERMQMSKSTITRLFGVAVVLVMAGAVTGTAAVIAAVANGAITIGGSQLVSFDAGAIAGAIVGLVVASLLGGAGSIAAIAAWAGALMNTYRLADKTWFYALLGSGLVSLGWVALIAYVFRGPDSAAPVAARGLARS